MEVLKHFVLVLVKFTLFLSLWLVGACEVDDLSGTCCYRHHNGLLSLILQIRQLYWVPLDYFQGSLLYPLKASSCFSEPTNSTFQDMVSSESNMNWWCCPCRLQNVLLLLFFYTAAHSQHCLFVWVPNGNFFSATNSVNSGMGVFVWLKENIMEAKVVYTLKNKKMVQNCHWGKTLSKCTTIYTLGTNMYF